MQINQEEHITEKGKQTQQMPLSEIIQIRGRNGWKHLLQMSY